jgi:hypothetical protein
MPVFVRTGRGDLRLTLYNGDAVLDIQTAATLRKPIAWPS